MKKLLIALATTVALVGPASAKWQPKPPTSFLPVEMQGHWCRDNDRNKWHTFHRGAMHQYGVIMSECPIAMRWEVWSNGWRQEGGYQDDCKFTEIDKLDRYVFYIRGVCRSKKPPSLPQDLPNEGGWHPKPGATSVHEVVRELHWIDGVLIAWRLPDA
jgi:hypothetical protein